MTFFILFILMCLGIYAALMLYFRAGWYMLPEVILQKNYTPKTSVCVVIPARNEEQHIAKILTCIQEQIYPLHLIEVTVVDDHSTDNTAAIVKRFKNVKLIQLADVTQGEILKAYKKKAIEVAIHSTNSELIVTTDADCTMGKYWLLSIVSYYEKYHFQMIASPVNFIKSNNGFSIFQSIDFFTMQCVTAALSYFKSGTMCNGANLAYTKAAFNAVEGFKDIDHIASGDDMLLMHKIEQKFNKSTQYFKCKDAIVETSPMDSLPAFFSQRIRWASKAKYFKDKRLVGILTFLFSFNLMIFVFLILGIFFKSYFYIFLWVVLAKAFVEYFSIRDTARFFNKKNELLYIFPFQLFHISYIIISAFFSQMKSHTWKDRKQ